MERGHDGADHEAGDGDGDGDSDDGVDGRETTVSLDRSL